MLGEGGVTTQDISQQTLALPGHRQLMGTGLCRLGPPSGPASPWAKAELNGLCGLTRRNHDPWALG